MELSPLRLWIRVRERGNGPLSNATQQKGQSLKVEHPQIQVDPIRQTAIRITRPDSNPATRPVPLWTTPLPHRTRSGRSPGPGRPNRKNSQSTNRTCPLWNKEFSADRSPWMGDGGVSPSRGSAASISRCAADQSSESCSANRGAGAAEDPVAAAGPHPPAISARK